MFRRRERRKDRSGLPVEAIRKQLEHLARQGRFRAAVMAVDNGLISVNIDSSLESEQLSALARTVWRHCREVRDMEFMHDVRQLMLSGMSGEDAVVCRPFEVQKQMVVLMVLKSDQSPHAELMEKAREGITRIIAD